MVSIDWATADKTILLWVLLGRWTWQEIDTLYEHRDTLLAERGDAAIVDSIFWLDANHVVSAELVRQLLKRRDRARLHARAVWVVPTYTDVERLLLREVLLHLGRTPDSIHFTDTIEEAVRLLRRVRA